MVDATPTSSLPPRSIWCRTLEARVRILGADPEDLASLVRVRVLDGELHGQTVRVARSSLERGARRWRG